jgi:hypothetical protein
MENGFELLDPGNARAFLKRFSPEDRRRGNLCFQRGCIQDLKCQKAGTSYAVSVEDDFNATVDLRYDPIEGWCGNCSCQDEDCPHQYAAMRALLAEHSTAVVRNLSASNPKSTASNILSLRTETEPGLNRRLTAALNRSLTALETKFVRQIQNSYARCRQIGQITRWDFEEMGLRLGGYGWDGLKIWPAFPATEHEFWLYVAHAAREHNVSIPEFMLPVTDFAPIEERLKKWQRDTDIQKWEAALARMPLEGSGTSNVTRGETDMRLVIGEKEAHLEWLRPGREEFEPIKAAQFHQISQDEARGWVHFKTEAALLWQLLSPRLIFGGNLALRFYENEARATLGRVLRTPMLDSRIVNPSGEILVRPAEHLHWAISEASSEADDYRLSLLTGDGTPAPPIFCVLPGKPALYLSANAIFPGPAESPLEIGKENRIPAPVIERSTGVAFLQALGLPLPPRVAERVRMLPFKVEIFCELKPLYPGSRSEDCAIRVVAEAPDGYQEYWSLDGWRRIREGEGRSAKKRGSGAIIVHDRAALGLVPALLAPLDLKRGDSQEELKLRVTRRFPEIFSPWLKSIPPEVTVHLAGELASLAKDDVAGKVKLNVTEAEIDWFDLRVVLNVSDTTLTQPEIKLLLNGRGNYVRLAGKGWRRLQYDLSEEENERLARLGLNPRELTDEPQRLHALQLADEAARKFLPEEQVEQIQRRAAEIKARVTPPLPDGIKADLRPYQLEGFHFLAYLSANRFGGILADDMGLGKTLQALTWLAWLRSNENGSTHTAGTSSNSVEQPVPGTAASLVVCPKSVMDNWRAEAERFLPGLRVKVWSASELETFKDNLSQADLHVLNYNQLRMLGETLAPVRWLALILDEGQYIKNPSSQTAQVARSLKAGQRLVLSGTPIENRLMDLWSLMAFAMPGVLGSRNQFGRIYDAKGDPFARRRLSSRVRPFLLRRTKAQVAKDLPDRIEEDLFCEIEGEQKTLYRAELKRAQQILLGIKTQKELAKQQFHFLTSLLRLRQICCHPKLVNPASTMEGAKAEALLEQLEPLMEEGNKVLVFSQFVELLNLLRPQIEARGWPVFYLAGDTENRGDLVRDFQSAPGAGVFLISLKAGGFGLNLTAASYVVLFDPWWNPAVENQAIDRTHRIGQVNKVIAYRLLIKNSIEEKIRELQKKKNALAQDVLGEEKFAQSLTIDDLHFLLAD